MWSWPGPRSPVENPPYTEVARVSDLEKETIAMGALVNKRRRKKGPGAEEGSCRLPPLTEYPRGEIIGCHGNRNGSYYLRTCDPRDTRSCGGRGSSRKAVVAKDPDSKKSTSFTSMVGSPGSIYQPGWGVTNNCRLDTPATCQDMVDHIVPPLYFSELRHLPNDEFLNQYNTTLVRQVAMGSQLREKKLEALLEAEADMKDIAEAKNVELVKELESLRVQFYDL
uniref:Uncharacterized protein n=1 Tax=Tanacetum cinerariifolium TaxID=118510 RepID=A0A6L2NIJ3_TANCI|nr:hypothetical protein [Tanacetum cinerariifolium]